MLLFYKNTETYNYLGNAYIDQGDINNSLFCYKKSISLNSGYAEAHNNVARTSLLISDFATVLDSFYRANRLKYGIPLNEKRDSIDKNSPKLVANEKFITQHKLKHDIEQFTHLKNQNLYPEIFTQLIAQYQTILKEIETLDTEKILIELKPEQLKKISSSYQRNLYIEPEIKINFPVINPDLDIETIQTNFKNNEPSYIFFDNFLTNETLNYLNNFCLNSTIWHNYQKSGGYLGASIDQGFNCEILYKIAESLKKKFPDIFADLPLIYIWAYKYDSQLSGIAAHADKAEINVNFWITPDDANLDPESGGMVIYDKKSPPEWDFNRFNAKSNDIYDFLKESKANKTVIPYRQNRVVIFNSDLFHETDSFRFKEGYENRRINITMLFGNKND